MRNIGKRLGAILLSALMVLSLIGVQPKEVSAEAGSTISEGNFGSGSTNVSMSYGIRFLLVDYDEYKCWEKNSSGGGTLDLNTTSAKNAKMKSNIKDAKWMKERGSNNSINYSKYAIYVGLSSKGRTIAVTKGAKNSLASKSVRSYSWSSVGKIIKKLSGNSSSVKNAFNDLKSSQSSASKWKNAFNKLEKSLLSCDYNTAQTRLKNAFKKCNATKNGEGYNNSQYYLIMEPIVFIKRGGDYVALSAQDLYNRLSSNAGNGGKSLLNTSIHNYTKGDNGITLAAGTSTKLRNLSTTLYQTSFKYSSKNVIKAKGNAKKSKKWTYSNGNTFQFYYRGGYAAIVPIKSGRDVDAVQAYQTSVYKGSVGDTGSSNSKLGDSTVKLIKGKSEVTASDSTDYYVLNTSSYLLNPNEDNKVKKSNLTNMLGSFSTNTNNQIVKIGWAHYGLGENAVGETWGTDSNSYIVSSNNTDYVIANPTVDSNVSILGSDLLQEENEDAEETGTGESSNEGSSDIEGDAESEDEEDGDLAEEADVSDSLSDMGGAEVTPATLNELSVSASQYGYSYNTDANSVGRKWISNSSKIEDTVKNAVGNAMSGASAKFKGDNGFANIIKVNNVEYVNNVVPFTSSVLVKKSSITSYGYEVTYDASNNTLSTAVAKTSGGTSTGSGSVTYKTFNGSSNSSNYGKVKGDKNAFYVVAVPNTSQIGRGQAAADYVKSKLTSSSTDDFMNKFEALANDNNFSIKRDCEGGDVIKVGAYQTKNSSGVATGLDGYTVVFIGIKGDIPLTGEEVLESYQLNNIDGDIASTFANQHNNANLIFTSRKVSTYKYNGNHTTQSCSICGASWNVLSSSAKSYNVNYKDKSDDSNKKYTIAYDNEKLGNYLIQTTINGGNIANRSTLKNSGENVDTANTTKKFTYAFNLVRKLFEDKTASSLTANNGINSDVTGVLKMSYGNVPSNVTEIDKKRDANAFVGNTLKETLKWTGKYTDTTEYNGNGKWRLANIDTFTHTCYDGSGHRHDTLVKNKYTGDDWSESIKPFKLNKIPMENAKIVVTEKAKKYQTENIATGKNENQDGIIRTTGVSGMDAKDINEDSILDNDTRYAYLEKHDITGDNIEISFYPEVKMMMYGLASGHNSVSSSESVYKKALYTMGEKKRTAQSSSLYLYRISSKKTVDGVGQKLTGKVYSDDMTTNSAGTGNGNTPVIYAGGNVSLKVDGANMNLNLYGYSVDLVNKAKDGTGFKINDTDTLTYKSVVDDESDIYSIWGNEETPAGGANIRTSNKLFNDYKAWVANMSNLDNYGADVTLKVADTTKADGVKEYNNFSTTIGKLIPETGTLGDTGNWASKEDGVYPIAVYNGRVFSAKDTAEEQALSKGYWNLVAQVQKDYNCDEETAIKVLDESGMFDAIYKAIESSTSEFNKSGKAVSVSGEEATNQNTAMLGDGKNWYDEVVKTFCIRRYVTETLHFEGTILSDKIDYDAAPKDNSTSSGLNDKQTKYNKANAKWFVSFYFKGNPNQGSVESPIAETKKMYHTVGADYNPVFYNPSDANSAVSFENAKNSFTVLTEKLHVDGADFIIPSSATTDESN